MSRSSASPSSPSQGDVPVNSTKALYDNILALLQLPNHKQSISNSLSALTLEQLRDLKFTFQNFYNPKDDAYQNIIRMISEIAVSKLQKDANQNYKILQENFLALANEQGIDSDACTTFLF